MYYNCVFSIATYVNVAGAVSCVKHVLSRFEKDSGAIIFTGGGVALNPSLESASMSLGKAALRNYDLCLIKELKPKGIYVGVVMIMKKIESETTFNHGLVAESYYNAYLHKNEHEIFLL